MARSEALFLLLFGAVALQRLVELGVSARNRRRALARGGVDAEPRAAYAAMVALHAAFLVAAPAEVLLLDRPFVALLGGPMLALALAAQLLRYWAIATLRGRWTTRVVVVPGDPAIAAGPYRLVRHPNYLAVALELFALPLVHTAWMTALVVSVANGLVLRRRIAREEAALAGATDYEACLGGLPRFLPRARAER